MHRIELGAVGSNGESDSSWADLSLPSGWLKVIESIAPASRPTDIQRLVLGEMRVLEQRRNLIVSAPTNSGKSLLGFLFLLDAVRAGKRALLIEPYRAIAQEKFDELNRLHPALAPFIGRKLSVKISTGDYRLEDELMQAPPPESGEILVATPERLEAIMRRPEHSPWWNSFGAVCVDEAHLVSSVRRGPTLEFIITSLLLADQPARMILLSATLGETKRALKWLDPCDLAHSTMRRPPLDRTVISLEDNEMADDAFVQLAADLTHDAAVNILAFTYRTDSAVKLAKLLNERLSGRLGADGALAYHAKMPKASREKARSSYLSGRSRCLITTTALAAGVNLPTTHVIVRDLTFQGVAPVDIDQLVQMAGRAGRGERCGHAFFIHRKNDSWELSRLVDQLKCPPFPGLSSALVRTSARKKVEDREQSVVRAAAVVLSLLVRKGIPMTEAQIEQFFSHSLVGDEFADTLAEALRWMRDPRRILAYDTEDGAIAPTRLGKAAIQGTLPPTIASGFGSLMRDVLSLGEEQTLLGAWSELDHLLIVELLAEKTFTLRPFSEDLARQVDAWMERSPKKSELYRHLLRGAVGSSKAEELFGSLLIEQSKGKASGAESARRRGYLAMFCAIVLWERANGGDTAGIERTWRISDLLGIEEQWRDSRIWLLSGMAEVCDLPCYYFHLQQECEAGEDRVRQIKRHFQRLRILAFDAIGCLKYCSPLGPLLIQMRRGTSRSPGVGTKTIQKLESFGVSSLATLAKMSSAEFKAAGVDTHIENRIRAYVRRRLV